ncbi:MAG: hypothetical protein GF341_05645, partial [candidate division Zixibacteria bacterium]|nr:hypothetical protein [candidate division Zixibacteria bacterium]
MTRKTDFDQLNSQLTHHMDVVKQCTMPSDRYGRLLLASDPESRYPYVYPRDTSSAVQLFRRIVESGKGYDAAPDAMSLMRSMALFMRDVMSEDGHWGQRYSLDGEDKSVYKQEDNTAHAIAIICNYLLAAHRTGTDIPDIDDLLTVVNTGLSHAISDYYHRELNLFESTTSIHESALETGFTCWVNFSYLYAFSLAHQVDAELDDHDIIKREHLKFRERFLYTISELFIANRRYIRRISPDGHFDFRPDFTLLSPFYFGFFHYKDELANGVGYLAKHLRDPQFDMIMRYLPFHQDFSTHVHAGNGPWLQYNAILAQYYFWVGDEERGDALLDQIERYSTEEGYIPEHLSTCNRFDWFMESEWRTGIDFAKEFDEHILLDRVHFDIILEEANNM